MKQAVIPNSEGVIPVQGFDKQVKMFKTALRFFELLQGQVEEQKQDFRNLAAKVVDNTEGEVRRVEFLSDDGSVVPVSLPDTAQPGNRKIVDADLVKEVLALGIDIAELGVTETETCFILTGAFVAWFRDKVLVPSYTAAGLPVPDGIQEKTTTRLSEKGIEKLEVLAREGKTENERKAAQLILAAGIKAASVSAK